MSKVDKNQLLWDLGIPLRLEIAARLMAGWASNPGGFSLEPMKIKNFLVLADDLIKAHNETCEDKDE